MIHGLSNDAEDRTEAARFGLAEMVSKALFAIDSRISDPKNFLDADHYTVKSELSGNNWDFPWTALGIFQTFKSV